MSQRSPFQRFARELRRRHVPQTAAIYLVVAWAAIEFADVVVPNLNGPQWVITAVIVAAGVGLPVVLVLAWFFDWSAEGIQRTPREPSEGVPQEGAAAAAGAAAGRSSPAPWVAAVAVLMVGIGSALAVAALLARDRVENVAAGSVSGQAEDGDDVTRPPEPPDFVVPRGFTGHPDSIRRHMVEDMGDLGELSGLGNLSSFQALVALGDLDTMDTGELVELARTVAEEVGLTLLIQEPREWRIGRRVPAPLRAGDTLVVRGLARDTAGVVSVALEGEVAESTDEPEEILRFTGRVPATGSLGTRTITITVRTADGREIQREYSVVQQPAGQQDGAP